MRSIADTTFSRTNPAAMMSGMQPATGGTLRRNHEPPRRPARRAPPITARSGRIATLLALLPGALLAVTLLPGALLAQRELVLQNLAPFARAEVAAVVVPFASGTVPTLPELHVAGTPTVWQAFGARWPDGSLRQAICLFRTELGSLREARVQLEPGAGEALPEDPIPMPRGSLEIVVRQGTATVRVVPPRVEDLEHNALRRVELRRARIGTTGLVAEVVVTACRDQPHAYCDVAVFYSDPDSKALECHVDELAIESHELAFAVRHAGRLGVVPQATKDGNRVVLLRNAVLGDGQGLRRTGALLPRLQGDGKIGDQTLQAAGLAPLLGSTDWRDSGAFGAFGLVPEVPPWLAGAALREHLAARHRAFVAGERPGGDAFAAGPLGLAKQAGQTGDQFDFGTVKLSLVAATGMPSLLFEAEASVLQEACRPVHFFEADAKPVQPAAHPDWIVWSGRTHWHGGVSPDRLGKPLPEPPFESHGWTGKDREHWSNNHLGAFALLTGSHWARLELQNEARLYLAGQTLDPARSTSGAGAPRGAGRTQLAACWMLLATGDPALRQRIDERVDQIEYPQWTGRELAADHVRPFGTAGPDARLLQGKTSFWNPWQEAIAAVGFAAVYRTTGNAHARELAETLAVNSVRHGWKVTATECIIATALRWQDGRPLTAAELLDPDAALWSYNTAFSEWAVGACEIARVAALREGDTNLAERAATIQQRVRATRQRPSQNAPDFGGLDRLSEWDAIRWQ